MYAHNSDGELPDTLRSAILTHLIDYRAGGIEVEVLPIVKVDINATILVMLEDDYDTAEYNTVIKNSVVNFLNDYTVGSSFHVADVIHFIRSSYEDVVINVTLPDVKDIELQNRQLVRPGNLTVNCINQKNWRYD